MSNIGRLSPKARPDRAMTCVCICTAVCVCSVSCPPRILLQAGAQSLSSTEISEACRSPRFSVVFSGKISGDDASEQDSKSIFSSFSCLPAVGLLLL